MADGTIPELQMNRLLGLGRWLEHNEIGIFGTRPWTRAESSTSTGIPVRFTQNSESLFMFILTSAPYEDKMTIEKIQLESNIKIQI